MSLEEEALKMQRGAPTRPRRRPPSLWEMIARFIALLALWAILSVIFWIPFALLWPIGAAVVLAGLTLLAVNLASRVIALGHRVRALEERAAGEDLSPEPQK